MSRLTSLVVGAGFAFCAVWSVFGGSFSTATAAKNPHWQQAATLAPQGNATAASAPTDSPTPLTLADLIVQFPDLKSYLDKVKGLSADKLDLAELYVNIITLYKAKGVGAVNVFLRDSGLLDALHVPPGYLDLLTIYDQTGIDGLLNAAKARKIINDQNELRGFMKIDSNDQADTVSAALQALGLSTYTFSSDSSELEIGVPVDTLMQFQSPNALLFYVLKIAHTPHLIGYRLPTPVLTPAAATPAPTVAS